MGGMSLWHWMIVAAIGILVFGRKFPDIGRSLGKGIVEFKKGLKGLEDDLDTTSAASSRPAEAPVLEPPRPPQRVATNVPKFEEKPANVPQPPSA